MLTATAPATLTLTLSPPCEVLARGGSMPPVPAASFSALKDQLSGSLKRFNFIVGDGHRKFPTASIAGIARLFGLELIDQSRIIIDGLDGKVEPCL